MLFSKVAVIFIVAGIGHGVATSQSMVPTNILLRVFCLKVGDDEASGFTIEVGPIQYLVTARHIAESLTSGKKLEVFRNEKWIRVDFRRIAVEPDAVDIAVFALKEELSSKLDVELAGAKNMYLSQPVFFVGFPYGLTIQGRDLNRGFPIPLVKHGIIAALPEGRGDPFLVDGINNPGFSGGPVVRINNPNKPPAIVGVISAYKASQEAIYDGARKTELTTRANTGLLVAFSLTYALEAIEKDNQAPKQR